MHEFRFNKLCFIDSLCVGERFKEEATAAESTDCKGLLVHFAFRVFLSPQRRESEVRDWRGTRNQQCNCNIS